MMALVSKGNNSNNKVNINTFFSGYEGVTTSAISSDVIQVTIAKTGNIYQVDANTAAIIGDTISTNYTITYNANGGTGAPPAQIVTIGENITLSTTIPTRDGYTFLGWSTDSSATSATYAAGASYTVNGNVTLYAVWQLNSSDSAYTITYNAGLGRFSDGSALMTVTDSPTTITTIAPIRSGYTFKNWSTTLNGQGGTSYVSGQSITLTGDITLYAQYTNGNVTAKLPINCTKVALIPIKWTSIILGF